MQSYVLICFALRKQKCLINIYSDRKQNLSWTSCEVDAVFGVLPTLCQSLNYLYQAYQGKQDKYINNTEL